MELIQCKNMLFVVISFCRIEVVKKQKSVAFILSYLYYVLYENGLCHAL